MHVQSNEQERAFGRGLRSPRCCLFVVIYFYLGKTFSKSAAVLAMQYGQVGSPTKSLIVRSALNTAPQSRQRTSSPTFHLRGRACAFSQLTFSSAFILNLYRQRPQSHQDMGSLQAIGQEDGHALRACPSPYPNWLSDHRRREFD